MSEDPKANQEPVEEPTTQDLKAVYDNQSMYKSTAMRINYKGPTDRADSWESDAHTGGPSCYPCCGIHCGVELIGLLVVLIVCCAYVSRDGTCCSICYWPF